MNDNIFVPITKSAIIESFNNGHRGFIWNKEIVISSACTAEVASETDPDGEQVDDGRVRAKINVGIEQNPGYGSSIFWSEIDRPRNWFGL